MGIGCMQNMLPHQFCTVQSSDVSNNALQDTVYDMIYLLTAIGLSPGGSSTVHMYTHTHTHTQNTERYKTNNT